MRFYIQIVQIIFLAILLVSCNREEIELDYSIDIISSDPGTNFHQIIFVDENTGFVVGGQRGQSGSIYKTSDGGQTWDLSFYTDRSLYSINFLIETTGFVGGESLTLLKTFDQGDSWEEYFFPYYPDELYTVPIKKFEFVNDTIVYLVGGMYFDRGLIARSNNGGLWWNYDFFDYEITSSHFFKYDYGILSGYGHFVVTRDGNETFEVMDFDDDFFTSLYFVNEKLGFACGYDGGIYKTIDEGKQWEVLLKANKPWKNRLHLNDIKMLNANKGIVVGNNGVILVTYDGGNSWKNVNLNEDLKCNSIFDLGNGEIMISCNEGKIVKLNF